MSRHPLFLLLAASALAFGCQPDERAAQPASTATDAAPDDAPAPSPKDAAGAPSDGERPSGAPENATASEDVEDAVVPQDDPAFPRSPDPDDAAWKTAPKLTLARTPPECDARVLGKFVRISCEDQSASYSEALAGDPGSVRFSHKDTKWSSDYSKKLAPASRKAVFSLAPGDRRVIQFADLNGGWRFPWEATTDAVISAYWLEGEAAPTVVID